MNKKFIIEQRYCPDSKTASFSLSGKHLQTCFESEQTIGYIWGLIDAAELSGNEVEIKRIREEEKDEQGNLTDREKLAQLRREADKLFDHYSDPENPVEFEELIDLVNNVRALTWNVFPELQRRED